MQQRCGGSGMRTSAVYMRTVRRRGLKENICAIGHLLLARFTVTGLAYPRELALNLQKDHRSSAPPLSILHERAPS